LAITGRTVSPGMFEIILALGMERCVSRLKRFIQVIRETKPVP